MSTETLEKTSENPEKTVTGESPIRVLFVCTGNTCRSPMAAAVLNALGKGKYVASSAGLDACEGDPMTPEAVAALERAGIESVPGNDYKRHKARVVDAEMLATADKVVPMTGEHMMRLIFGYPGFAGKFEALPSEIPDPFMGGAEVYGRCLAALTEGIKIRFGV